MLSPEQQASALNLYKNGQVMGDLYRSINPQALERKGQDIAWFERFSYGLGAQAFHLESGLAKKFPDFNPIELADLSTALGYEMGSALSFNRDVLLSPFEEEVVKAKKGFKYAAATLVVKSFNYVLSEDQIPDPEARSFYYFKEALFSGRDPLEIIVSLLTDNSFKDADEAKDALCACRKMFLIRISAGRPTKRFNTDEYLSKNEIADGLDSLISEARTRLSEQAFANA